MNKFSWGSFLTLLGVGALSAVTPAIQTVVAAHPVATTVIGTIWGILGHFLPQPAAPK